jgi:hypothetical protein
MNPSPCAFLFPFRANYHQRALAVLLCLGLLAVLVASRSWAATRVVTNLNDSGPGSLRDTIALAAPNDTITFSVAGTIDLSSQLVIDKNLVITGPGARQLTLDAHLDSRVFNIGTVKPDAFVAISGLTLYHGQYSGASGNPFGESAYGGGIFNAAHLTMTNCAINDCHAVGGTGTNGGGDATGGGIQNDTSGNLTLTGCTLSSNTVRSGNAGLAIGGGMRNLGAMSLTNCTFYGNSTEPVNAAVVKSGAIDNIGTASIVHCTISGNSSYWDTRTGQAGGISNYTRGNCTIRATIVAGNSASWQSADLEGSFTSQGYNLIGQVEVSDGWVASDQVGSKMFPLNPELDALQDNGGPTDTRALRPGGPDQDPSPAIDAAVPAGAPPTDQRGYLRYGPPDIGAYELNGPAPLAPVNTSLTPSSGASEPLVPRLFTTRYTDGNGVGDLSFVYFLINSSTIGSGGLWGYYDLGKNRLYLRNNANTAWLGGVAPGTNTVISDPQGVGSLDCANTTVSPSGNTLTVNWSFTPNAGWNTTTQNLYMYVRDREGLEDGWDQMGTWGISHPPVNGGVSPSGGSSRAGTARTLTATYTDPDGAADLTEARILISAKLTGAPALQGYYNAGNNRLYLRNKANTAWLGGFLPQSNNTISEPGLGSLNCAATQVTKNGNTLTINWSFTPDAAFSGGKYLFLYSKDKANSADGWDQVGTWNIQ